MKIAIIHDSLTEFGGSERVLKIFIEIYPDADIYTAYSKKKFLRKFLPEISKEKIFVSWAQNTPLIKRGSIFQLFSPLIWRSFNLNKYDLILSNTSYLGANLINANKKPHVQYVQSPPKNLFRLDKKLFLQKIIPYELWLAPIFKTALRSSPFIISNSVNIQRTLFRLSGAKSEVIYPPVHIPPRLPAKKEGKFYLIVSRLDSTKNLDLAILACNRLRLPLKIVGVSNDPDYYRMLRRIAGKTVEFLGFKSDKEIAILYQNAIAFVFPPKNEDFGIAPVEAMAHGVPVIAYFGGGTKETVVPGKTGEFFYKNSADDLISILKEFNPNKFSRTTIYQHAKKYSERRFKKEIKAYIRKVISARPDSQHQ